MCANHQLIYPFCFCFVQRAEKMLLFGLLSPFFQKTPTPTPPSPPFFLSIAQTAGIWPCRVECPRSHGPRAVCAVARRASLCLHVAAGPVVCQPGAGRVQVGQVLHYCLTSARQLLPPISDLCRQTVVGLHRTPIDMVSRFGAVSGVWRRNLPNGRPKAISLWMVVTHPIFNDFCAGRKYMRVGIINTLVSDSGPNPDDLLEISTIVEKVGMYHPPHPTAT